MRTAIGTVMVMVMALTVCAWSAEKTVKVEEGVQFNAVITEMLSSKVAKAGDPVMMKADEDVVVDGMVVIAKGKTVRGAITEVQEHGFLGKRGKINLKVESTTAVDGQRIVLRATKQGQGKSALGAAAGGAAAGAILLGPAGLAVLFVKGKHAEIPEGTKVVCYIDEEKSVKTSQAAAVEKAPAEKK